MDNTKKKEEPSKKTIIRAIKQEAKNLNTKLSKPIKKRSKNESLTKFNKDVFNKLPKILASGCSTLVDDVEKEVFLVSAIGLLSGVLPKVAIIYDGNKIYANLYIAILGRFGSGKGAMKFAKRLLNKIEDEMPAGEALIIPTNNSKTGVLKQLETNNGRGVFFETEASTVNTAFKSEHGKYKDVFLCGTHHEPLKMNRTSEGIKITIEEPKISAAISSTPIGFSNLIYSTEDGLYSRFLYYFTPNQELKFRKVLSNRKKKNYISDFDKLAEKVNNVYTHLKGKEDDLWINFTRDQALYFERYFEKIRSKIFNRIAESLNEAVFRIALSAARVIMVFTVLRYFEDYEEKETIDNLKNLTVDDVDFYNALEIVHTLITDSVQLFDILPEGRKNPKKNKSSADIKTDKQKKLSNELEEVKKLHEEGQGNKDIAMKLRMDISKVKRLKNKLKKKEVISDFKK